MLFPHRYLKPSVTFSMWFYIIKTVGLKTTMTITGKAWFSGWAHWGLLPSALSTSFVQKIRAQTQILAFLPSQIWSWHKRGLHLAEDVSEDITRKSKFLEIAVLKNWCFWTVVLEKTLDSPLEIVPRRSNQSILKEISPEYSLEGLMLKLKL